jgi:hypothetical protein
MGSHAVGGATKLLQLKFPRYKPNWASNSTYQLNWEDTMGFFGKIRRRRTAQNKGINDGNDGNHHPILYQIDDE